MAINNGVSTLASGTTYQITMRLGIYADFDPDKMVAGEIAIVTSGDPNTSDGKSMYACFQAGNVKRISTYEDIFEYVKNTVDEYISDFDNKHLKKYVLVGESNYLDLGITDVTDFLPNKIYGIQKEITEDMISNLPYYGNYATLITYKPSSTESSTGFTRYDYVSGGENTYVATAFSYTNGRISQWEYYNDKIQSYIYVNALNYNQFGITDITDFLPNKVYAISNAITEDMISNLPEYGLYSTLMTFKGKVVEESTGYTAYLFISPNSVYISFSTTNGKIHSWIKSGGGSKNTITVGNYSDCKTITDAVNKANDGDTILIYPGVYEEQINCVGKTIHFKGIDRESTIIMDKSGDYRTPPLEMSSGSVESLTIIETGEGTVDNTQYNKMAYCIHMDFGEMLGNDIRVRNVTMKNGCHACVGIGAYKDTNIIFENCSMEMESEQGELSQRGCFYAHTRNESDTGKTSLTIKNCQIDSQSDITMTLQVTPDSNVGIDCAFINNTFSALESIEDSIISNGYGSPFNYSDYIAKNIKTNGNNIQKLN